MDVFQDVLVLKVMPSIDKEPIYILKVYDKPIGKKQVGDLAKIVKGAISFLHKQALIIDDVNIRHIDWDNRNVKSTTQARKHIK